MAKKLPEKLSKIIADIGMTEKEATWDCQFREAMTAMFTKEDISDYEAIKIGLACRELGIDLEESE